MELNPYESPAALQPMQAQEPADANSVHQLLVEIRDGQRELLEIQREALRRQQALSRWRSLAVLFPIIVVMMSYGFIFYLRSTIIRPAIPTRPATAPLPPTLTPPSASVGRSAIP